MFDTCSVSLERNSSRSLTLQKELSDDTAEEDHAATFPGEKVDSTGF